MKEFIKDNIGIILWCFTMILIGGFFQIIKQKPKHFICHDSNGVTIIDNKVTVDEVSYNNEIITYTKTDGTKVSFIKDNNLLKCKEKE
ncbi:hypothetical protein BKK50_09010 [Rodentibacter rarus]|uniref:Uncharacterized protein n=1 Tax=Rodentibacter rarus TaxID=1908260 RepID=A0A1V3IIF2_9PAST|nr:hypothetical protein [Rodentibacter rarus]OOF41021.1 hypothetical protein BKK50_09010 [Rodentibacter rarus]